MPVSNNDCFLHRKMRLQKCLRHSDLRCPFSPGFFDTASPGPFARPVTRVCERQTQQHRIRLRAERKAGQLLGQMDKAKGAREPGTNRGSTRSCEGTASTLDDLGISKNQSSQWQKMGAVPQDEFDRAMAEAERPTTNGILRATQEPKVNPVSDDGLGTAKA
jgi:hypothetical protein